MIIYVYGAINIAILSSYKIGLQLGVKKRVKNEREKGGLRPLEGKARRTKRSPVKKTG
jgi:hypothetical protein